MTRITQIIKARDQDVWQLSIMLMEFLIILSNYMEIRNFRDDGAVIGELAG